MMTSELKSMDQVDKVPSFRKCLKTLLYIQNTFKYKNYYAIVFSINRTHTNMHIKYRWPGRVKRTKVFLYAFSKGRLHTAHYTLYTSFFYNCSTSEVQVQSPPKGLSGTQFMIEKFIFLMVFSGSTTKKFSVSSLSLNYCDSLLTCHRQKIHKSSRKMFLQIIQRLPKLKIIFLGINQNIKM